MQWCLSKQRCLVRYQPYRVDAMPGKRKMGGRADRLDARSSRSTAHASGDDMDRLNSPPPSSSARGGVGEG